VNQSVAIVGGGLLGIATARRLASAGCTVTIFEAAPTLGGLAAPWQLGDLTWDRYYHVTLASDAATRELFDVCGVGGQMQLRATSTGYWDGTRVVPAATVSDFLRLPGLGLGAKLRIGATIAVNARRQDWQRIERTPVEPWLRRWSGSTATERFWLPQLRAKLGADFDHVAASFLWATFRRLDRARRGAERREQMGYLRGGWATAIEAVAAHLLGLGVQVHTGCRVDALASGPAGVDVIGGHGTTRHDAVIVTLAAPLAAALVDPVDADAAESLRSVRTMGVVCASLLLDRPLSPHYLTYLAAPSPLTAVVDMSALVDPTELAGRGLVYLPRYVAPDDELFDRADAEIEAAWVPALRAVYPELADRDVLAFAVARTRHVFAVPDPGYSMRVPPLTTADPRVHVVSSAHLVHATLNVDETVSLGRWAADELVRTGRIERSALLARG
jgi:protoporphyrinogen oxidase